jgi:hypothetical protein
MFLIMLRRRDLVVPSTPATEETGAMYREIEYRHGIALKNNILFVNFLMIICPKTFPQK